MNKQFNKTTPLLYSDNNDNYIYHFNPDDVDDLHDNVYKTPVKRAKLIRFNSSVIQSITRRSVVSTFCKRSVSNSSTLSDSPSVPESEFYFTNPRTYSSDEESLPDLIEDGISPLNSPLKTPKRFQFLDNVPFNLDSTPTLPQPSIFEIPEIVHKIIQYVDVQNTELPREPTPIRRKPLSLKHALLIHGNRQVADSVMKDESAINLVPSQTSNTLMNCLLVNKLFYQITSEVISKRFYFNDEGKLANYISSKSSINFKPEVFILNRLFRTKQVSIEKVSARVNFTSLKWLEFYMCPKIMPTIDFLGPQLLKLTITGSKVVDDEFLTLVSRKCPNLEVLDVRACDLVSDAGVYQIGDKCTKLTCINFGRKQKGYLITDSSISHLVKNNTNLVTVGLAGCHIRDKSIWDLAIYCSSTMQRLSLNNCPYILNQSIPLILSRRNQNHRFYFENLLVLELRFNLQITNWVPVIEFKRRQEYKGITMLLEACETLMVRIRQQELHMDKQICQRIFKDVLSWANGEDDGDIPFQQLLESRRKMKEMNAMNA